MLRVVYAECHKLALYTECHYTEWHYAGWHYAEWHYAECHNAECHYAGCRDPPFTIKIRLHGRRLQHCRYGLDLYNQMVLTRIYTIYLFLGPRSQGKYGLDSYYCHFS
jgi:hypothetical protein